MRGLRGRPKRAFIHNGVEFWGGPCSAWAEIRSPYVIALTGQLPRLPVEAVGISLELPLLRPKGLVMDWPDFGVLPLRREDWEKIAEFFAQVPGPVYVCCGAGVGRTGTVLAILAGLYGLTRHPVAFIRQHYLPEAVETAEQERYVAEITGLGVF